ncbi:MAG: bifunctional adenosylcobinamide kinase/adenosylcobinamide-phosphate guanylyltransferase [Endomicrobia bacterium]|nr:bifunctional adenosylcobinamide kinase/adenosylcobinamide-phosphate guanylyltransferase [Endomicrobiia bacterium]
MMILVTGGIKSGKSKFALNLVESKKNVYFIATAYVVDNEMKNRIETHIKERPSYIKTKEAPIDIEGCVENIPKNSALIIDCINFWLANIINRYSKEAILEKVINLCEKLKKYRKIIFVSNEVGMCLVEINKLGRYFQEMLGKVNQIIASYSDEVYLMVAGIPLKIK